MRGKQPRDEAKVYPMHGIVPKHEFWHSKWPIAIPNMHNMDMQRKYRSKALPSNKKGQKVAKEASAICKAQTEKFPSTTLNKDQKYNNLQNSKNSKTVYKHARNAMQNKAQK